MRATAAEPVRPGYRYYVLAVLVLIYALNFLDRRSSASSRRR
jgi:hypothetical protein